MNGRGHYGNPRIGAAAATHDALSVDTAAQILQAATDARGGLQSIHEMSPEDKRALEEGTKGKWTPTILIAAGVAIVGIGVIGVKRGVKFM